MNRIVIWLTLGMSSACVALPTFAGSLVRHPQEEAIERSSAPYRSRPVSIANLHGGVTLAGTISIPDGHAPFPGVLFIAASGRQTRDEEVAGHRVFVVLADHLLRRGIAVLRVDKRGVGSSTGEFSRASFGDLVSDAAAAFAFLKVQPEIDPHHVGLLGHSEGGSIAPAVAVLDRDASFVVAMAGSGLSGRFRVTQMLAYSTELKGASPEQQSAIRLVCEQIFGVAALSSDGSVSSHRIAAIIDGAAKSKAISPEQAALLHQTLTPSFVRQTLGDKPVEYLKRVTVPVLALVGSLDRVVPADPYVDVMRPILARIPGSRLEVLPGLNHVLQTAHTGSPAEFGTIEETLSPVAMALIGDWLILRTSRRKAN